MVPGGRKRRDSASVGTEVPGARRPGDGGPGELAAGGASGHNRRRRPGPERREQPRRAEPPLAGTGPAAVGSRTRAVLAAGGWEPAGRAWRTFPGSPALFVPAAAGSRLAPARPRRR